MTWTLFVAPSLIAVLLWFVGAWCGILALLGAVNSIKFNKWGMGDFYRLEPRRFGLAKVILLSLFCTLSIYAARRIEEPNTITPPQSVTLPAPPSEGTRIAEVPVVDQAPSPELAEEPMPKPPGVADLLEQGGAQAEPAAAPESSPQ